MKRMNSSEINVIIDSLQGCLNWNSEDLEKDFSSFLNQEIPTISKQEAETILQDFLNLPAKERSSVEFDYYKFLEKYFN